MNGILKKVERAWLSSFVEPGTKTQTGGRLDSGDCTGTGRTDGVVYFLLFSSRAGSANHVPFAQWANAVCVFCIVPKLRIIFYIVKWLEKIQRGMILYDTRKLRNADFSAHK